MADDFVSYKTYTEEERFLDHFGYRGATQAIVREIGDGVWIPNYNANDDLRGQINRNIEQGFGANRLFFDAAWSYIGRDGRFAFLRVAFKSAYRTLIVRAKVDEEGVWSVIKEEDRQDGTKGMKPA